MRKDRLSGFLSLVAVVAAVGCGGSAGNHNYSGAIARSLQTNGAQQLQRATNGLGDSRAATIDDARCVQSADPQAYSCVVHYTYHNSEGTYRYQVKVSATCDRDGNCRWHTDGGGKLVSAEPD